MDIYTYLFKNQTRKVSINFEKFLFDIKFYSDKDLYIYEIFNFGRLTINRENYISNVETFKREFDSEYYDKFLEIIKIINKYHYVNFCTIEDRLTFHGADFITVNTLSGLDNPYFKKGFKVMQKNFPKTQNLDLMKSNTYYYHKFVTEKINILINSKVKDFAKQIKNNFGKEFQEFQELKNFDYILKDFIVEKANLEQKKCYDFFYKNMSKILYQLQLLPKNYIIFF